MTLEEINNALYRAEQDLRYYQHRLTEREEYGGSTAEKHFFQKKVDLHTKEVERFTESKLKEERDQALQLSNAASLAAESIRSELVDHPVNAETLDYHLEQTEKEYLHRVTALKESVRAQEIVV